MLDILNIMGDLSRIVDACEMDSIDDAPLNDTAYLRQYILPCFH